MTYGWPTEPGGTEPMFWVRANFVSSVDGSAVGADGKSGSVNNEADHRVFQILRETCDVVLVGRRTAEIEGYPTTDSGQALVDGKELVLVDRSTPPRELLDRLEEEGKRRILLEGGPSLLGVFIEEGLLDELCLSVTPRLIGGPGPRILTHDERFDVPLKLVSLIDDDSTLLLRYVVG